MCDKVVDSKGIPIRVGDRVRVNTIENTRLATVVEIANPPAPTHNNPGFWVDIDDGRAEGREGFMSYALEVIELADSPCCDPLDAREFTSSLRTVRRNQAETVVAAEEKPLWRKFLRWLIS